MGRQTRIRSLMPDKWQRRRRRTIGFAIVSILLAVLVASVLVVAFDRGLIR